MLSLYRPSFCLPFSTSNYVKLIPSMGSKGNYIKLCYQIFCNPDTYPPFLLIFVYTLIYRDLSWISRQILKAVIVLGVLVGVATTVTSLFDLIEPDAFTVPCYALSSSPSKGYSTNCTHVKLIPKPNTAEC